MTESEFIANLDSILRSDDTKSESSRTLPDNDDEDSDSDTSGKFNEEPDADLSWVERVDGGG
jgi:hypothetical protein